MADPRTFVLFGDFQDNITPSLEKINTTINSFKRNVASLSTRRGGYSDITKSVGSLISSQKHLANSVKEVKEAKEKDAKRIRELQEELGISTVTSCLAPLAFASHDYPDNHLILLLYACRRWQGEPVHQEGGQVTWVRAARLRDYPMPPADLPLISMLQDWL